MSTWRFSVRIDSNVTLVSLRGWTLGSWSTFTQYGHFIPIITFSHQSSFDKNGSSVFCLFNFWISNACAWNSFHFLIFSQTRFFANDPWIRCSYDDERQTASVQGEGWPPAIVTAVILCFTIPCRGWERFGEGVRHGRRVWGLRAAQDESVWIAGSCAWLWRLWVHSDEKRVFWLFLQLLINWISVVNLV